MSNISGVVARVFVDDLETAIPLYQQLAQATAVNRFGFQLTDPVRALRQQLEVTDQLGHLVPRPNQADR